MSRVFDTPPAGVYDFLFLFYKVRRDEASRPRRSFLWGEVCSAIHGRLFGGPMAKEQARFRSACFYIALRAISRHSRSRKSC